MKRLDQEDRDTLLKLGYYTALVYWIVIMLAVACGLAVRLFVLVKGA